MEQVLKNETDIDLDKLTFMTTAVGKVYFLLIFILNAVLIVMNAFRFVVWTIVGSHDVDIQVKMVSRLENFGQH